MRNNFSLRFLLSVCLLVLSNATPAADQNDTPTRSSLENQLNSLNKNDALTTADKAKKDDIEQTLTLLDSIDKEKVKAKDQEQLLSKMPAKVKDFARQLDSLKKNTDSDTKSLQTDLAKMTQSQLDSRLTDLLSKLQSAQNDLGNVNSQITFLQTLPERAQAQMSQDYQRMQDIRNQLSGVNAKHSSDVTPSMRIRLNTELTLLQLRQDQRQKDLDNNTSQQELYNKQRDLLTAQIQQLNDWIQLLQKQASDKRLTLTEKTLQESGTSDANASEQQLNPVLQKEQKVNQQLSQRLIATTQDVNTLVQENIKVKNWLDRITQTEQNLNEQISVLKGSLLLSKILYQQRQMLPDDALIQSSEEQIADLRLAQFDVNQQRDQLYQRDEFIKKIQDQSKETLSAEDMETLEGLLDGRRELLDQLNKQLGQQLNLAINVQLNQQQLQRVSNSLQSTLQQQMFWVSSNKQIDTSWLTGLPSALLTQWQSASISLNLKKWAAESFKVIPGLLIMLALSGLMIWKRRTIQGKFDALTKEVGQLRQDTHYHTPKAIVLVFLRTIPGALFIMAIGTVVLFSGFASPLIIGELFFRMALAYMAFGSILRMLKPNGMAEVHFGYDAAITAHFRRSLRKIWYTVLPLILIATYGELDPARLADDVLGQIIALVSLLFLSVQLFNIVRKKPNTSHNTLLRNLTMVALGFMPLALIGFELFGYYYTALKLSARLVDTFYLVSLWVLIYHTALRGVSVAARRLAYRRAIAKRQSMQQRNENAEGVEIEEKAISLEEISEQTLRLLKVTVSLIFVGTFYWLWSDLVTVIAYLDSITLWHHTVGTDANAVLEAVSLRDLLSAAIIATITYILTRNLPGLLEVLVLSKMQLAQGTSYAITTMLSYAITALGAIATLSTVGMEWSKLQWLVAALSVGLGFGLQEIFANFVSGLIILFERPVRIGDTVTVSGFSGNVNKIRIRATTIIDFDRKEVIIPNRAFVTERLINWSLTDTVTRVVLKVGVAYGSNLDLTKRLLLQAAHENARVMKDPDPTVYFLTFGASTLDHEMRFYVKELGDRNPALDELNRRIDQLFTEHGINIAFNQVEVTLKNAQGQTVDIATATAVAGAAVDALPTTIIPPEPEKK